jgi:hypothetical protein
MGRVLHSVPPSTLRLTTLVLSRSSGTVQGVVVAEGKVDIVLPVSALAGSGREMGSAVCSRHPLFSRRRFLGHGGWWRTCAVEKSMPQGWMHANGAEAVLLQGSRQSRQCWRGGRRRKGGRQPRHGKHRCARGRITTLVHGSCKEAGHGHATSTFRVRERDLGSLVDEAQKQSPAAMSACVGAG